MLKFIKNTVKLSLLFMSLYVCSIFVILVFDMMGMTFTNLSNTAFYATITSTLVLLILNYIHKKKKNKQQITKN